MDEPNSPVSDENETPADAPSKRSWFQEFLVYILHCAVATIGVFVAEIILGLIASPIVGNSPILKPLFGGPLYVFPILIGAIAGSLMYRRFRSTSAMFVWILPAILFAWTAQLYWGRGGSQMIWHDLLGTGCGDCVEQWLTVAPFYISVAYSVGALAEMKRRPVSW